MDPLEHPFADQFRVPAPARFRHRANRVGVVFFQMDRNVGVPLEDTFSTS
jgi:hypothetical protein